MSASGRLDELGDRAWIGRIEAARSGRIGLGVQPRFRLVVVHVRRIVVIVIVVVIVTGQVAVIIGRVVLVEASKTEIQYQNVHEKFNSRVIRYSEAGWIVDYQNN